MDDRIRAIRKRRLPEVREFARKIEMITGCRVPHAGKGAGSYRYYAHIILERKDREWAEDFTKYRKPFDYGDCPAGDWLVSLGLPRPCWVEFSGGKNRLYIRFYWADFARMGWNVPDFRTEREKREGISLADVR